MKFSNADEFELHVHKCFNRIFELLLQIDKIVKDEAEKEEAQGQYGKMSDVRDWMEEVMLHCHLAWQYHRLSKGSSSINTWDHIQNSTEPES